MPQDILIQADGNPLIKSGDFAVGESTRQHQSSLLKMHPGELKFDPSVGVGLSRYLEAEELQSLPGAVSEQFELDGMQVLVCEIGTDGNLNVNAPYVD